MQLKRLWDITNKKMVFVKGPTGHECQLWVDEATEKMYYYDMSQWLEYTQRLGYHPYYSLWCILCTCSAFMSIGNCFSLLCFTCHGHIRTLHWYKD